MESTKQLTSSAEILTCNLCLHSGQPITPWIISKIFNQKSQHKHCNVKVTRQSMSESAIDLKVDDPIEPNHKKQTWRMESFAPMCSWPGI